MRAFTHVRAFPNVKSFPSLKGFIIVKPLWSLLKKGLPTEGLQC